MSGKTDKERHALLSLKKELKCWESMFERKHSRKPSKTDIEKSPAEIQDAYHQYRKLKSQSVHSDEVSNGAATPTTSEEEVFGVSLNKPAKMKLKEQPSTNGGQRKSMWKLRRWTKERGYVTVKSEDMGSEGCDGVRSGAGDGVKGEDCDGVRSSDNDEEAKPIHVSQFDAVKFSQLETELHTLAQEFHISAKASRKASSTLPPKPVVSGECQNVLLAQKGGKQAARLKSIAISTQWLGRCKPELELVLKEEENENRSRKLIDNDNDLELEHSKSEAGSEQIEGEKAFSDDTQQAIDDDEGLAVVEEPKGREAEENGTHGEFSKMGIPSENTEAQDNSFSTQLDEYVITETCSLDDDLATWSGDEVGDSTDSSDEDDPVISSERWSELSVVGLNVKQSMEDSENISTIDFPQSKSSSDVSCVVPNQPLNSSTEARDPKSALGRLESNFRASRSASTSTAAKCGHSKPKQWSFQGDKSSSRFLSTKSVSRSKAHPLATSTKAPTQSSICRSATPKLQHNASDSTQSKDTAASKPGSNYSTKLGDCISTEHQKQVSTNTQEASSDSEADSFQDDFSDTDLAELELMETEDSLNPEAHNESNQGSESEDSGTTRKPIQKTTTSAKPATVKASSTSSVSDNFVRLNMKVKRFSRKRGLTGSAHKRLAWKKIQKSRVSGPGGMTGGRGLGKGGRSVCYKCGNPGHWAKNCDANVGSKNLGKFDGEEVGFCDKMATGEEEDVDEATLAQLVKDSPFPSVEDAALMARGVKFEKRKESGSQQSKDSSQQNDSVDVADDNGMKQYIAPPPCYSRPAALPRSVEPLFSTADGKITATPKSVHSALKRFGYDSFRPGQEEAVMRVLSGVSTLLINSTGSGKSLCYQLPAYLYGQAGNCLALVISPLVSLMEDQVHHFPIGLKGGCLHTNQTKPQREKVLKDAVEGRLNVLLLSPEALVGGALWSKSGGVAYSLNQLPPVAFACIDEAHCVSEWSHNFRPSYLRVYKVLRERLGVYCVLALTATATYQTALSVATNLGIAQGNIIRGPTLPDNLHVSVSCDQDRDQALVELLQNSTFRHLESIIIYCTRQQETERIAQLLRTCLTSIPGMGMESTTEEEAVSNTKSRKRKSQASASSVKGSKRRKVDWSAECYHAGMQASRRRKVQSDFMSGRLRIVVATVAFGMGLNKSDVRAIIHYNLPKSFESFVQEIGRAGRDGLPAYCHVFIDKMGGDLSELRRHAYSNTVERYCVKQLLRRTFPICQCGEYRQTRGEGPISDQLTDTLPKIANPRWCCGHEVAFPIEAMVTDLDVKEECISTLLCYLELEDWLEVLNPLNDSCTLKCYSGARQLRALAAKVPAVAAATARLREKGTDLTQASTITFSVVEVADSMGWESHIVRSELRDLSYNDRGTGPPNSKASSVLVEFGNLSFHLRAPGDMTDEERDKVCDFLFSKVKGQEEREVEKLHLFHAVLRSVAGVAHEECFQNKDETAKKLESLNAMIKRYFSKDGLSSTHLEEIGIPILATQTTLSPDHKRQVCDDINALVSTHAEQRFSGRAIARILYGIASPQFEAIAWGGQKRFWRRHMDVDFNLLCQLATKELLNFR